MNKTKAALPIMIWTSSLQRERLWFDQLGSKKKKE